MFDDLPTPMQGVYPFVSDQPGGVVVVHTGPATVAFDGRSCEGDVRVWVNTADGLDVLWQIEIDSSLPLKEVDLSLTRAGHGEVEVRATVTHSAGSGHIAHAELGEATELSHVMVHWFNLPAILPSTALRVPGGAFAGRWVCEAANWRLTLDQRPDHAPAVAGVRGTARAVLTHIGKLEKSDGSSFNSSEAHRVLAGWQAAFSFATGRWVAPALPVGFRSDGSCAWEQWAPWHCSRYHGYWGWWDTHRSQDLQELCQAFLAHWLDDRRGPALRHAASHAICASSDDAMLEAKVSLAQSGFEYLAWVTNVLEGNRSAKEYREVWAHKKLSEMLARAHIPDSIPPELEGLAKLAPSDKQTGPLATTWLRNKLVHPKDPAEPYRIESAVWSCWMLSLEYLELLLLHRLEYRGRYLPKRPGIWAHRSAPVPWAVETSAQGGPHYS